MKLYYTTEYEGGREASRRYLRDAVVRILSEANGEDSARAFDLATAMMQRIEEGELGKPVILGFFDYSISHTGRVWAVLFDERPCGLDVQEHRVNNAKGVAHRFFTEDEAAAAVQDDSEFFRIWARREALRKAVGISAIAPGPSVLESVVEMNDRNWQLRDIELPVDVTAAICVLGDEPLEIERL